jgi:hypothetical protein
MIITDEFQLAKTQMAARLLAFRVEEQREDIHLDIIETIALHMRRHEDLDVFELGLFVRANLAAFELGSLSFPDIHTRFMAALLAAPQGPDVFARSLLVDSRGLN